MIHDLYKKIGKEKEVFSIKKKYWSNHYTLEQNHMSLDPLQAKLIILSDLIC